MNGNSVSVVIPTWNRADLLAGCLANLAEQTLQPTEVIVVDNGSTDDSAQIAQNHGARVVRFTQNRGFAVAINEGIRQASANWIFILNNDVVLNADWLEQALAACNEQGALFAAGKLLQYHRPSLIDGTWDLTIRAGLAWRCGFGLPDGLLWSQRRRIASAPMTAALFHRNVFETIGLLDEEFESYYEDVDFGLRCGLAGLHGVYEPLAVGKHMGSATLGSQSKRVLQLTARNQIWLLAKHYPTQTLLRFAWPIVLGHLLSLAVAAKEQHLLTALTGKWAGLSRTQHFRRHATRSPEHVERVLLEIEGQFRQLHGQIKRDKLWTLYFALV